jgi:anti-anti-sigma factor
VNDFHQFHQLSSGHNVIELRLPEMIDAAEFDELNELMATLLDERQGQRWIIDLSATRYLGSSILGLFVNVRHRVRAGGGKLVLCGLSDRLAEIIHMCSMERLFTIAKNQADAIKVLGR